MGKIKKYISKNIPIIILCLILFAVCCFSGINTYPANDDLPYSLFYRGEARVENIKQVVKNQLSDYNYINGRFLVHCLVQFVLIYDRVLFAIINAAVIVATICLIAYIAKKHICVKNDCYTLLAIISAISFFMLFNFKWMIYWVAGSVNYVWMFLFVLIIGLYYLKTNFDKYTWLNFAIFFLLGNLHENSLVVAVILYIAIILEQIINKKINIKKLLYIIPMIIGAVILLKAPGNANRMSQYEEWYSLNIIQKLLIAVPELSKSILSIDGGFNLLPLTYILITILSLVKEIFNNKNDKRELIKSKVYVFGAVILTINTILCIITKNKWLCMINIIAMALIENYIHFVNKRYRFIVLSLSMYAVAFSMCITPLYYSLRPNYYLYMYYSILIVGYVANLINMKSKTVSIIASTILVVLLGIEGYIYANIGKVARIREKEIAEGIENKSEIIYLTRIPDFCVRFHNDCNTIGDEDYWAKQYLYKYYGINEKVDLVVKEK